MEVFEIIVGACSILSFLVSLFVANKVVNTVSSKGMSIQYITTLNEEGTLSNKFGDKDLVNQEFIEEHSVLTLSPTDKLFGIDF